MNDESTVKAIGGVDISPPSAALEISIVVFQTLIDLASNNKRDLSTLWEQNVYILLPQLGGWGINQQTNIQIWMHWP